MCRQLATYDKECPFKQNTMVLWSKMSLLDWEVKGLNLDAAGSHQTFSGSQQCTVVGHGDVRKGGIGKFLKYYCKLNLHDVSTRPLWTAEIVETTFVFPTLCLILPILLYWLA